MEKFNFKKLILGASVVAASVIPKGEANAEGFLSSKNKNLEKTEQASNKEEKIQEKSGFNELTFCDIKYPFDKEYKTDDSFYRTVTYGESMDQMTSIKIAMSNAKMEILKQTESVDANISRLRVVSQKTFFKNDKYITIIAVEVIKDNVSISSK